MPNEDALKLFSALSWHSLTRTAAGWAHELKMHKYLSCWSPPLTITQTSGPASEMQPSSRLLRGTLDRLGEVKLNDAFYWIPSVINIPGVDSVLGQSDGKLFIIQATIADDHKSPKEGMNKVWQALGNDTRRRREWHLVIVTDTTGTAESLVNKVSRDLIGFEVDVQVWGCVRPSW